MYKKLISKLNRINKNQILIAVAVLAIVVTGVLISAKSNTGFSNVLSFFKLSPGMSADAIAKKSIDYLNKSVLQNGQTATLVSDSEESGIVKIKIKIGANTYDSYASKDGKLLFPEGFNLSKKSASPVGQNQNNQQANQAQASAPDKDTQEPPTVKPADIKKVAKPSLDVFVVSRCPFGIQIQRAIGEAVKSIPSLAEFINVRYIGSVSGNTTTAMHGDAEALENRRQKCMFVEQKEKSWKYVSCQMKSGDTAGCQESTGVDIAKLNACLSDPNRGLAYAKEDFALGDKYKVQGSPTLVLNAKQDGQQISEYQDFGGRSADSIKGIVCKAFVNPPDFCSTKLNTEQAATSFSPTYSKSANK